MHRLGIAESGSELRTNADRHPDIGGDQDVGATKSVRSNTDDGVRLAVDLESAANKIASAAHAFPETVADDDDRNVGIGFAFLGTIKPSSKRLGPHEREVIFRSEEGKAPSHLVIASDAGDSKLECGKVGKNFAAVVAQVAIFIVGERAIIVTGVLAGGENVDHFLWPHWHRGMQHQAVDQRENGRVNANGEREGQHRDGGK